MRVTIRKWGNSASVRIPASVMEAARLKLDAAVDVREENGTVVIAPVDPAPTLDDLLAEITPENIHDEVECGEPVGREAL